MSDLHGDFKSFKKMLKLIKFNSNDTLYIIGDIIDRGSCPIEIYNYIQSHTNVFLLMGNHEKMMIDFANLNGGDTVYNTESYCSINVRKAFHLWMNNGGNKTIDVLDSIKKEKRLEIIKYFNNLPYYKTLIVNNKKFILCHARPVFYNIPGIKNPTINESLDFLKNDDEILWCRDKMEQEIPENYIVIHGHTRVQSQFKTNSITYYSNNKIIDIDCGCVYGGRLACLRLDDMQEFYIDNEVKE